MPLKAWLMNRVACQAERCRSYGCGILSRSRGCKKLRQERHLCRETVPKTQSSPVGATYLSSDAPDGSYALNLISLLTELWNLDLPRSNKDTLNGRSEERRVGKEGGRGGAREEERKRR